MKSYLSSAIEEKRLQKEMSNKKRRQVTSMKTIPSNSFNFWQRIQKDEKEPKKIGNSTFDSNRKGSGKKQRFHSPLIQSSKTINYSSKKKFQKKSSKKSTLRKKKPIKNSQQKHPEYFTPRTSNSYAMRYEARKRGKASQQNSEKVKDNQFEILDKIKNSNKRRTNPYETQKSSRGQVFLQKNIPRYNSNRYGLSPFQGSARGNFSGRVNRGRNASKPASTTAQIGYSSHQSRENTENDILDLSSSAYKSSEIYKKKRKTYQPSRTGLGSKKKKTKQFSQRMKVSYLKNVLEELKFTIGKLDKDLALMRNKQSKAVPLQLLADQIRDNQEEIRFMNLQYGLLMKENLANKSQLKKAYDEMKRKKKKSNMDGCQKELKKNKELKKILRNLKTGFEKKLRLRSQKMEGISAGQLANEVGMLEMRYSNDKQAIVNDMKEYLNFLKARNSELKGSNNRIGFGRFGRLVF